MVHLHCFNDNDAHLQELQQVLQNGLYDLVAQRVRAVDGIVHSTYSREGWPNNPTGTFRIDFVLGSHHAHSSTEDAVHRHDLWV